MNGERHDEDRQRRKDLRVSHQRINQRHERDLRQVGRESIQNGRLFEKTGFLSFKT